jgi:hypothetical protein
MTRRIGDDRGFALPAVIFLVALLTLLLTSGLTRVDSDLESAMASEESTIAFAIAQSGLQAYMGSVTTRPTDGDSVRINVPGGYANVVIHLVRRPASAATPYVFLVRSTGIVINPAVGSTPQARRTVAQYARWQNSSIERRAAYTAANGIMEASSPHATVRVRGTDACGVEPAIPAVRTTNVTNPPHSALDLQGNPDLIEEGSDTGLAIATQTHIDWASTIGGGITPDYDYFRQLDFSFPVQRVAHDLSLTPGGAGTGLLIVPGDLNISGAFYFEGVILVGGRISFAGDLMVIRGLVVSGLNEQLGQNPQRTTVGNHDHDLYLYFDSCKIQRALAPFTGLAPVQNAWLDNWASY